MYDIANDVRIQPKKRTIYAHICEYVAFELGGEVTVENIYKLKENISGIGDGCIAWCNRYFTDSPDCIEYTDIKFKKGFENMYHVHEKAFMRNKIHFWKKHKHGRIANIMIMAFR